METGLSRLTTLRCDALQEVLGYGLICTFQRFNEDDERVWLRFLRVESLDPSGHPETMLPRCYQQKSKMWELPRNHPSGSINKLSYRESRVHRMAAYSDAPAYTFVKLASLRVEMLFVERWIAVIRWFWVTSPLGWLMIFATGEFVLCSASLV